MSELSTAQTDKLLADLKLVVADAEELLRITADAAGDSAAEMRGRVQASLAQARANLAQLQAAAVARARAASRATDEYVHDNPWKAIGIAGGVGLLLGLLIGRR